MKKESNQDQAASARENRLSPDPRSPDLQNSRWPFRRNKTRNRRKKKNNKKKKKKKHNECWKIRSAKLYLHLCLEITPPVRLIETFPCSA